jgi:carbon-monoxide dehydrogenase catalytic subunit
MGVDHDYRHLIMGGLKCSLADGGSDLRSPPWSRTSCSGTPRPIRSRVNLGVLAADKVNIIARSRAYAVWRCWRSRRRIRTDCVCPVKGRAGINLAGICCTANEVLMRHGLPIAGNFLQQELAILTGAVEMMVVDVQCVMASLAQVVKCFHTKPVSTSESLTTSAEQIISKWRMGTRTPAG